jgi:hypothetical protein
MGTGGTTISCFCVGISITKPAPRRLRAMNPAETGDASIRAGYASTFDDEKLTRNRGNKRNIEQHGYAVCWTRRFGPSCLVLCCERVMWVSQPPGGINQKACHPRSALVAEARDTFAALARNAPSPIPRRVLREKKTRALAERTGGQKNSESHSS